MQLPPGTAPLSGGIHSWATCAHWPGDRFRPKAAITGCMKLSLRWAMVSEHTDGWIRYTRIGDTDGIWETCNRVTVGLATRDELESRADLVGRSSTSVRVLWIPPRDRRQASASIWYNNCQTSFFAAR
jgi:hypothetical protein